MASTVQIVLCLTLALALTAFTQAANPVFPGWYADPEGIVYGNRYWIFPTYSASAFEQTFFDAFSSPDMVTWTKHPNIISTANVSWAHKDMWAPSVFSANGRYYFLFGANAINNNDELGGIGIAVADRPEGPYEDMLGHPLIGTIENGAQPIDQFVFKDVDGSYLMYYGGWSRCNVVKLNADFTGIVPFDDGVLYREVTPSGYVEGPFMFMRNGTYYFMWSEGGWGGPDYRVAYAKSDSPFGPFVRRDTILQQDSQVATGAGHHSVIQIPGRDEYYIVYHRRPLGESDGNHRVTCVDKMEFDLYGNIFRVRMTFEGVVGPPL